MINSGKYRILCHLPNGSVVYGIKSERVCAYNSLQEVPVEASGFVVAPFQASAHTPVFLFTDIEVERITISNQPPIAKPCHAVCQSDLETYATAFKLVKHAITSGSARKVVLARSETVNGADVDMDQMFAKACCAYPRCYVALMTLPDHGTWLTATPELLYRTHDGTGQTIALAGTMTWAEVEAGACWTTKNMEEQKFVSNYIGAQLAQNGVGFSEEAPRTVKAGDLAHIQTDFTLHAGSHSAIDILRLLHPTPAVAGMPKSAAIKILQEAEGADFRQYYAGFSGFLNCLEGETACFVTLRLMHQDDNDITLYAGGGILEQSTMENEWNETSQKLNIMKRLLGPQEHGSINPEDHV